MGCSPPGSSVHGTFQARIVEWVVIFFSRVSSWPRDWNCISCTGRWILYHSAIRVILTLFITAKRWKRLKCPPTDENGWRCGMYAYNGILLNHRKNEILLSATTWMNLKSIMLGEISHKEQEIFYVITYTWNLKNKRQNIIEQKQTHKYWELAACSVEGGSGGEI